MKIFISVVSHHNSKDVINTLEAGKLKNDNIKVIIRSNIKDKILESFCDEQQLTYSENDRKFGFGKNHNLNFSYCQTHLNLEPQDYFLVTNPDIKIDSKSILNLVEKMNTDDIHIAAPDLYRDAEKRVRDDSIRKFPKLLDIILRYTRNSNNTLIDRSKDILPTQYDWASGALLCFKANHYKQLHGFDEKYFMYYEDVDICWRSMHTLGKQLTYIPGIKATHTGQRTSRKKLNKYLLWHIRSSLRFCIKQLRNSAITKKSYKAR